MSQASASAKPPPWAAPFTAAITGTRRRWIFSKRLAISSWAANVTTIRVRGTTEELTAGDTTEVVGVLGSGLHVRPGTEADPFAGEHHHAYGGIAGDAVDLAVQSGERVRTERIAAFRPSDRQEEDALFDLDRGEEWHRQDVQCSASRDSAERCWVVGVMVNVVLLAVPARRS